MLEKQQKPKFLNLFQIAMPVTAVVSILHRVSGLVLVLVLPLFIYVFYLSIQSKTQFDELAKNFDSLLFRFIVIALIWVIAHHIFAGIRYLLLDIDLGLSLSKAKISAWLANIAAVILTLVIAMELL